MARRDGGRQTRILGNSNARDGHVDRVSATSTSSGIVSSRHACRIALPNFATGSRRLRVPERGDQQDAAGELMPIVQIPLLRIGASIVVVDAHEVLADQRLQAQAAAGGVVDAFRERIAEVISRSGAAVQRTVERGYRTPACTRCANRMRLISSPRAFHYRELPESVRKASWQLFLPLSSDGVQIAESWRHPDLRPDSGRPLTATAQ